MIIAHKITLDPNGAQRSYFARARGPARFAYNWALAEWKQQYLAGEKPSEASLRRKLNSIKDEPFPWMREVTKKAPQRAIKNPGTVREWRCETCGVIRDRERNGAINLKKFRR